MLQHSDGFDSHVTGSATLSDGDTGWTGQTGVSITASNGKFGGKSLRRAAATPGHAAFSNPGTEKAFAAYFGLGTFGGSAETSLLETSAGDKLLTVNQAGDVKVYDGGTTLRVTKLAGAPGGSNFWIEVDFTTAGIALFINGVPSGSYTGAYTAIGDDFYLLGASPTNTPITDVDDFMSWDSAGSFFNTFGLRPQRIQLLRPDADGDTIQWTPASGTNHAAVDDTDWTGGVGVTSIVAGQKDLYGLTDLAVAPSSIKAVVIRTKVQNTGDNPAQLAHVVHGSDGSEAQSPLQAVPTVAAGVLKSVFYQDSNGVAWTAATVNALQAGQVSSN